MSRHALAVMPAHADVHDLTVAPETESVDVRLRGRDAFRPMSFQAPSRAHTGTAR